MVKFKIKLTTVFRWLLYVAVFFMCDYANIVVPTFMESNIVPIRFIVGFLGIVSTVIILLMQRGRVYKSRTYLLAEKYLVVYTFIVGFVLILTAIKYHYTMKHIIYAITPYLYTYYTLLVVYLCEHDKKPFYTIKRIATLIIWMLCIKAVCWALYNFMGTILFESLIFRYGEGWVRGGFLRVDPGCLFGLAFSVVFSFCCVKKKNFKYKVIAALMLCFVVFISQFRYQVISIIVVVIVGLYASSNNRTARRNKLLLGCIGVLLFVALGGVSTIFSSFSVVGENGSSTLARLLTITHYWSLMREQNAIFGLGILNLDNPICYRMMTYMTFWGAQNRYFLEDIGIIGGFYQFGLLAVPLYGILFAYAIKSYKMCRQKGNREFCILLACIGSYLIFSNMVLNIFDGQRAFAVPFYLSIISYCHGVSLDEPGSSKIKD